ncbi:MAG: peptidyl-prolyl cis-trans isomerase, partial [Phycisphaerales bacterium]|nr:peptidyl-prolyl cis-trans isomerase [Phycisphaerales bacterium]
RVLALAAGAFGLAAGGGGGCAWVGLGDADVKKGEAVSAGAFRSGGEKASSPVAAGPATPAPPEPGKGGEDKAPSPVATGPARPAPAEPGEGVNRRPVVAVVDEPPRASAEATGTGRDVLADSMVGQINGRPVFASEVLDPLDDRLGRLASGVKGGRGASEWVNQAAGLIQSRVEERVRDELLLGEARSRLTPEARQGLIYFLQRIDQWASGRQGGSRERAEESVMASEGVSYEKFLAMMRDKTLIQQLIKENVTPNVRVPWRKVERFYEENQDIFNPPVRAVVRVVEVDARNEALLGKVREAAAAPDPAAFRALAASADNQFRRDRVLSADIREGRLVRPLTGPEATTPWVGNSAWNAAIAALKPGEATGPVDIGPDKAWVRREADVQTPHRSLEDVELEILTSLTQVKENSERGVFFQQLLGKGSFTPINRMTVELLVLAAQRHLSPEIAAAVRDANKTAGSEKGGVGSGGGLERSPVVVPSFGEPRGGAPRTGTGGSGGGTGPNGSPGTQAK